MEGVLHIKGRRNTHRTLLYLFDWSVIFISALVGALLFGLVPVRQHLFRLDDPEIAYPFKPDIISFGPLMLISFGLPLFVITILSVFVVKSKRDFHHGAMGLCQTVALLLVTTAIVKIFLGGLRPHFLERCKPDLSKVTSSSTHGYGGIYYETSICTNTWWEVNDAQSAFPSAHSAIAAGGLNYLSLYLNGKFKVFQHQGHLLVYMLIVASSFGSVLVGFTRVVDYHHTFYNVMMGWSMGFLISFSIFHLFGISMYRLNYVSIFGALNHVPVADTWHEQKRQQEDSENNNSTNKKRKGKKGNKSEEEERIEDDEERQREEEDLSHLLQPEDDEDVKFSKKSNNLFKRTELKKQNKKSKE